MLCVVIFFRKTLNTVLKCIPKGTYLNFKLQIEHKFFRLIVRILQEVLLNKKTVVLSKINI